MGIGKFAKEILESFRDNPIKTSIGAGFLTASVKAYEKIAPFYESINNTESIDSMLPSGAEADVLKDAAVEAGASGLFIAAAGYIILKACSPDYGAKLDKDFAEEIDKWYGDATELFVSMKFGDDIHVDETKLEKYVPESCNKSLISRYENAGAILRKDFDTIREKYGEGPEREKIYENMQKKMENILENFNKIWEKKQ